VHKAHGKILDLAIFSSQEALSHCTLASNWELPLLCSLSLAVLNVSLMRAHLTYVCTLPDFTTAVQSGSKATQKLNSQSIMSQLWLRMVGPWQDQSDQFQCLCCMVTKCKVTW